MNLFGKERDLIHRIANLVLILWLVGAIFICYSSFVDMIVKEPLLTLDEYKVEYCGKYVPAEELDNVDSCNKQYEQYKISGRDSNYYNKKNLVNALGNVLIVGTFLYFLNRKQK